MSIACRLYGSITRAAAMTVAAHHYACVLTGEAHAYGGDDVDGVIGI